MIGRACVHLLAAAIAAALWPIGWWDRWHTTHPGDPWATDE